MTTESTAKHHGPERKQNPKRIRHHTTSRSIVPKKVLCDQLKRKESKKSSFRMKLLTGAGVVLSLVAFAIGIFALVKVLAKSDWQQVEKEINSKEFQLRELGQRNEEIQLKLNDVNAKLYEVLNKHQKILKENEYSLFKKDDVRRPPLSTGGEQLVKLGEETSCRDFLSETVKSGLFTLSIGGERVKVLCDMEKDGGGWTVIQRRYEGIVDFYQDYETYEEGFGDKYGEYWLASEGYELLVELEDWIGNKTYAKYKRFVVGGPSNNYKLTIGAYSGDAGDALAYHNNRAFSAKNRDNDAAPRLHCARKFHGAWWYGACHTSNLNGEYLRRERIREGGINWWFWKKSWYSMKSVGMKIRPK